ncbi:PF20097 family protein [Virgibacillus necropolis]|uniref:PF20097 family protein n=1 Tax=Virgibacillus necropolis TaxID=163877 RepID=UPI00384EAD81
MNDNVICPECSNELKQGYIFSPRRICWSESADSIFADFGSEEVLINDAFLKISKTPAFRCEKCNLVIFKHK